MADIWLLVGWFIKMEAKRNINNCAYTHSLFLNLLPLAFSLRLIPLYTSRSEHCLNIVKQTEKELLLKLFLSVSLYSVGGSSSSKSVH